MRLLDEFDVFDPQLLANNVEIPHWIYIALDVNDLGIVKAAYYLEDSIDCSDVRQESVAETGTSGSSSRETSDIVDCKVGRHLRLRLIRVDEPIEPLIGHNDSRLFRVDSGIREVGRVAKRAFRERLEESRLPYVGETDLSALLVRMCSR